MKEQKTFIVEIKDNQASTWQGRITWVEEHKKENFRSLLELIKLMDSTVEHSE